MASIRRLVLVLGDQLNHDSAALEDFDPATDRVWMAENDEESTHVWCHQFRLVAFFAPMRHFRDELISKDYRVIYHELTSDRRVARGSSFASILRATLSEHDVDQMVVVKPGDYRVEQSLLQTAGEANVPLDVVDDNAFFAPPSGLISGHRIANRSSWNPSIARCGWSTTSCSIAMADPKAGSGIMIMTTAETLANEVPVKSPPPRGSNPTR